MRTRILLFCMLAAPLSWAQDPTHSSGWVVIPVPDYQALRAKAFPSEPEPEAPPVEATLTRIDYDLHIDGDFAAGTARLAVDVLRDGWVRVPFPPGLLVREARLDGRLAALTGAGKSGSQSVLLSKRGRSVLQLEVAFHVASKAGEETLTLPAGASGVTRAAVTLPRQEVDVKVAGGFLSERAEAAAETKWVVYGRGQEPLILTWRRKMEDHRSGLPLRFRGSLTELLGLGEDSTSVYAEANLEVLQGAAREVRIQLPEKVTVNQVQGATVADWEMKPGELTVSFLEPAQQATAFTLAGEARLPRDGTIEIPLLRLLDAERETGGVAVEVLGAGEIKGAKSQGLESVDATELGSLVSGRQSPSLAAFRLRPGAPPARSLTVEVARYAQQAVLTANVEEARYRVLMTGEGKTLVQARYAVRNNQRNFVKIALPAGATVWSASLSGHPVRPGQAPDGGLLFPLAKTRAGEEAPAFALEVLYLVKGAAWDARGQARLALPVLDLPASRTGLTLYYPPLFRVTAEPGSFRTQAYVEPAAAVLNAEGARAPTEREQPQTTPQVAANAAAFQSLVSSYQAKSRGRKDATLLPIAVSFPAVGPSMFLVSELTGENQGPTIDFTYQRERKGGAK
jgi:hypothetical protein